MQDGRLRLHHHRRRLGRRGAGGAAERGSRPSACCCSKPAATSAPPRRPSTSASPIRCAPSATTITAGPSCWRAAPSGRSPSSCGAAARSAAARPSTARSRSAASPRISSDWAREGAAGWGWKDVLPYFCRLESDVDFGDAPYHGKSGPIPVYRAPVEEWGHVDRALMKAASALGYGWCADHNAPEGTGVSPYAINSRAGPAHLDQRRLSRAGARARQPHRSSATRSSTA